MPYKPRSLDTLSGSVRGLFRQYLPGTDATILQNVIYVFAKVLALLGREYELRLEWLSKQMFLSTATDPAHVAAHASDYRIYRKAASSATGEIETIGQPGQLYQAGIRYLAAGQTYLTIEPVVAGVSGAVVFPVVAEGRGAATNRAGGVSLTLVDPSLFPTLSPAAEVTAGGIGGGADIEDLESLRARALERKARPPQGGALSDYEAFAKAVPGVLKAWGHRFANGAGTVGVYFLFEGRTNLIPTAADIAAVQDSVDARRLIRIDFVAQAPIPRGIDVLIDGLPVNPELRAAVEAAIRQMLYETGRPSFTDDLAVVSRTAIANAISDAAGTNSFRLLRPVDDVTLKPGEYPVLGTVVHA